MAGAILLALKNNISVGKIYNLSNRDNPAVKDLFSLIAETVGYQKTIKRIPYKVALAAASLAEAVSRLTGKPPALSRFAVRIIGCEYQYSTDAIEADMGFLPKIDVRAGIVEALEQEPGSAP